MGQAETTRIKVASLALALVFCASCKVEEQLLPTGGTGSDSGSGSGSLGTSNTPPPSGGSGSQSLTAPIVADPLSGTTIAESTPTLTVLNSARSGGEAPTYLFQVSADSSFASLEAQSNLIPEGGSGQTSWEVNRELGAGRHFWRVRARAGTTESNFSTTADFSVNTSGTSSPPPDPPPAPPPSGGTILSDPLRGGSIGEVSGGAFVSTGWQVRSNADYIRYEVPSLDSGWVEFDTSGMLPENPDPNQHMLFGMWDPSAGPYRQNRFRVHLQKLYPNPHNPPYLRLRWIAQGEQHDEGNNFITWGPSRTYHWRIEWGPSGSGHQARVSLEGQVMITVDYTRSYSPDVHWIELGIAERAESIVGVTYSNFRVGR